LDKDNDGNSILQYLVVSNNIDSFEKIINYIKNKKFEEQIIINKNYEKHTLIFIENQSIKQIVLNFISNKKYEKVLLFDDDLLTKLRIHDYNSFKNFYDFTKFVNDHDDFISKYLNKLYKIIDFNKLDHSTIKYFFEYFKNMSQNENIIEFFSKDFIYHILMFKDSLGYTIPLQILMSNNKILQQEFMNFIINYKFKKYIYQQSRNQINFITRFIMGYCGEKKQFYFDDIKSNVGLEVIKQKTNKGHCVKDLCQKYSLIL